MKKVVLSFLFFSLCLCTTGEMIKTVNVGDDKKDVVSKLGKPDGQKMSGDTLICFYVNRLISGWSWDRADYYAKFLNDQLIEYGTGNVRQRIWIAVP
jgi:hypothetical protein